MTLSISYVTTYILFPYDETVKKDRYIKQREFRMKTFSINYQTNSGGTKL